MDAESCRQPLYFRLNRARLFHCRSSFGITDESVKPTVLASGWAVWIYMHILSTQVVSQGVRWYSTTLHVHNIFPFMFSDPLFR